MVKDFYLQYEKLPTAIPTGEYALFLTWIFDKKPQAETNIFFAFVEDL